MEKESKRQGNSRIAHKFNNKYEQIRAQLSNGDDKHVGNYEIGEKIYAESRNLSKNLSSKRLNTAFPLPAATVISS